MNEVQSQLDVQTAEQVNSDVQATNLLGLDRTGLEAFFLDMGEKKFRATQVMKWIHQL